MYADDTSLAFASADVTHLNYCLDYDLSVHVFISQQAYLEYNKTEFMLYQVAG